MANTKTNTEQSIKDIRDIQKMSRVHPMLFDNTQRSCYVIELSIEPTRCRKRMFVYTDINNKAKSRIERDIFYNRTGFTGNGMYFTVHVEDEGKTTAIDMHQYTSIKLENYPLITFDKNQLKPNLKNFTDKQTEQLKEDIYEDKIVCDYINIDWEAANIPALKGKKLLNGKGEKFSFQHPTAGKCKIMHGFNPRNELGMAKRL